MLNDCEGRQYSIAYRKASHLTTLKEALDAIVAGAPGYKWTLSEEGAINVLPAGPLPQFLETEISFFDWDVNSPMVTALASLSASHDVRKRRLELNLIQMGHGGLRFVPGVPVEKPKEEWRRVEHVSFLSALNTIARSYGRGVWVYSECRRGESVVIQLTNGLE